jgi:hypothetical protein
MAKKQIALLIVALALLSIAAYHFISDWFAPEEIQITHTIRLQTPRVRGRSTAPPPKPVPTVIFVLDRRCRLTEVKVVPLAEWQTNKYAHPVWHLISESNSVPVKSFAYGAPIRGMHPPVRGAQADPLQPGVTYRLLLKAGEVGGEYDFQTTSPK